MSAGSTFLPNSPSASNLGEVFFEPSPQNAQPVQVRVPGGKVYPIAINQEFDKAAAQTFASARNRRLWRRSAPARDSIAEMCQKCLQTLGLNLDKDLATVAQAGFVEIGIPAASGEAARLFPWEFVVSQATASLRGNRSLLVWRHLEQIPFVPPAQAVVPSILIVRSAPGDLANTYSFESEHKLVQSSFDNLTPFDLTNPTLALLKSTIGAIPPAIVHFAGIDPIQAAGMLNLPESQPRGMILADEEGTPLAVAALDVASAATCAATKPWLVSYNFYNSSWPMASDTVLQGAKAAIGFQDEIDDTVAELFFARLYEAYQRSVWDLLFAFKEAWKGLSEQSSKLRGTGIVLWSSTSLMTTTTSPQTGTSPNKSTPSVELCLSPSDVKFLNAADAIQVVIDPPERLNYSMLHNNRPLFKRFEVKRQTSGRLVNVQAEVTLNTGAESATYIASFDLSRNQPVVDVNDRARVSLTSAMALSLNESVYTSLQATVRWGDRLVYQETYRVALLPPDEWRDDDLNRVWLPSFVLPRDPVIAQIVDSSQKYLSALQDDSSAGFDGYQGIIAGRNIAESCQTVDQQVRALWWTLIQEYQLAYINPPPSFTSASQRLRTPRDVISGKRGTCIDLSLLLAALLEYVDIHPVVFLLQGHAFPGYVRSEESYTLLRELFLTPPSMIPDSSGGDSDNAKQREWIRDRRYFAGIVQLVRDGLVVPIESVALTQRSGFWDAVDQGTENLKNKADFQFVFDIKAAREADVTPIPLWRIRQ